MRDPICSPKGFRLLTLSVDSRCCEPRSPGFARRKPRTGQIKRNVLKRLNNWRERPKNMRELRPALIRSSVGDSDEPPTSTDLQ